MCSGNVSTIKYMQVLITCKIEDKEPISKKFRATDFFLAISFSHPLSLTVIKSRCCNCKSLIRTYKNLATVAFFVI